MANGDGTQTAQATSAPQPPQPVPDHLSDLRIRPLDTESTWQTLKRNVTPEIDTSRSALGPGHEFDNSSPQQEGEQQYQEMFGSPLERAYGHLKGWLGKHEQQVSEKYLQPVREHLDRMGDDLETAAETGHTKTQGRLSYPARLVAGGVGGLLKLVPVGRNVQETVQMSVTPPELGPEGKALSRELKATKEAETFWHGSPSGDLHGSASGLHVGTKEAAKQALEARIGIPADGKGWSGNREYGKTLLAGKRTLKRFDPEGYNQTGYNVDVPVEDHYPTGKATYSDGTPVAMESKPDVFPVRITGEMTNTPATAHEDFKANALMRGQLKKGAAKRGYYYKNVGEDEGSISAVVPSSSHLERIHALPEKSRPALPPQPRLPDTGTHAAIKTDDGSIYFDDAPEKQRSHITLAKDLGIPPERVVSGGWLQDGHYEASERSDAGRWGEQARAKAAVAEKRAARAQSELPAPTTTTPEAKAKERAANLRGLGIGLTEMAPEDAKNWVGYTNQKSLKVYRGVDDPAHTIEPGDFVTTSKESAQNYGKHVQEMEVSPSELRYVRGHKDGDPKRVGMGGQVELVYAPAKPAAKQATDDQILNHFDKKYPAAKETVDGHTVREHVPNYDSISASLAPNYEVLDGVREIPMSHFDDPGSITPRTKQLAADIKESGEINPLIVGIDHRGPYILEGGHRFDALRINKAKSFPAVVALDLNKGFRPEIEEELGKAGQTETLYHGSPDVSKIDQLKPGSKGGYFGDGIYLTRDPNVARRFTKLEAMNPTLERNADGSFTDINTGKRIPGGKPGVIETTLKDARLKKITMDEMDAEIEKFRKPNGVIDLDGARNAIAQRYAKQGYDGFDVSKSKYFDEPQVVIFPSSAKKLSINKPEAISHSTIEGAQPLADRLGAKVVGSVATGKTTADPYGINRGPKDLDLRIDGEYKPEEIQSKLKDEGYEFRGSSVLSPQEQKASGKNYGKPGWKRAEHFENSAGQKIDVWHDETGPVVFRNGRPITVEPPKKLK